MFIVSQFKTIKVPLGSVIAFIFSPKLLGSFSITLCALWQQIYKHEANKNTWVGMLIPYLNKYLSDVAVQSLFSHGGVWDIMDKREDGLWQRVTIHPFIHPPSLL